MISTHILDTSQGIPAADVLVELDQLKGSSWTRIGSARTNADGRIAFGNPPEGGTYRLQFHVADYLKKSKLTPFFLEAPVIFQITDTSRKYHVPLLLNPYGYTTYRGS